MADTAIQPVEQAVTLEGGTYEIIRSRLEAQGRELNARLDKLNEARQQVFGALPTTLVATERITTQNNCVPRDMEALGRNQFLFGYNVHIGLKSTTELADVFAAYEYGDRSFRPCSLSLIEDKQFKEDFKTLYQYYKQTVFDKFSVIGPHLFMVFRVGRSVTDIKTFKWLLRDGQPSYQGNRSDHEVGFPPQHDFEWVRTHRELQRYGKHPHISVEDRLFVETIGGDLTIKIEDNTDVGQGIYAEPVEHKDQTLDDAEIFYASLGNLILLKIRPYQERDFRYFAYNEKVKEVRRIDTIADACVLLPDQHGIIFSNGYYLQLGEFKQFPSTFSNMMFERRVASPNGEDYLYVFYNRLEGVYVLMSYNIIAQKVESPITCNGFSIFPNGELAFFKAEQEPQKHHVIQIWQTPYLGSDQPVQEQKDSFLFKLGNPAIVHAMAECREVLTLLQKEDTYGDLYVDLVKKTSDMVDTYFWLDRAEAFDLKAPLLAIHAASAAAIDEFEKVRRLKRANQAEVSRVTGKTRELLESVGSAEFSDIQQYVEKLAGLRGVRGELIALKGLRYVDVPAVEALEKELGAQMEGLSQRCVEFLLKPEALDPYRAKVTEHQKGIEALSKATETKAFEEGVIATGHELEMLVEIVSNLKIEDATQTTRIIDDISNIFAPLNQTKAALRRRLLDLQKTEGQAQFNSQLRLLDQSVVNYLELCDSPEKTDEYLNKIMVHVEELEGRFSAFDEFMVRLAEKRDELYTAFEDRKLSLVEARNKKTTALMTAAERILKAIRHRVEGLESINDIHGYYASDLMVDRVRDIIQQLTQLQDSVKADDLQGRLKTIREDAVRQLKDRQELFVDGGNVIQFGRHKFSVNTQELALTLVHRDGEMHYHLVGTNFFEVITEEGFLATRPVWEQELVSESPEVYRGEFLAYRIFRALEKGELEQTLAAVQAMHDGQRLALVQTFMAPRYSEGYQKGLHDQDASLILRELVRMRQSIGLLRYPTQARACATFFWHHYCTQNPILAAKLEGFRVCHELLPAQRAQQAYIRELQTHITEFNRSQGLFPESCAAAAGEYLFHDLTDNENFVVAPEAAAIYHGFDAHLRHRRILKRFNDARQAVAADASSTFQLLRDWVGGYLAGAGAEHQVVYLDEAAALLYRVGLGPAAGAVLDRSDVINAATRAEISGLMGTHACIANGVYSLDYHRFMDKLERHEREAVPLFEQFHARKARLIEERRQDMRLEEFRPRVLTSFVRNRLIDTAYLPLIGDNLAKQIGVAGEATRTDRSGLLLLISPPGYGKTTLMEYIANRLGIIFMKINGPALGHQVTSLDPAEARNASAREEIEKLNLALEMGDNVMIYLDDIQHCNPELLQKFISLCDAQRKIEGVFQGEARTYDLRGRKVAVVMAGNPYTESGTKFQVPDMLANRADTYNLGDIVGQTEEVFKTSYLENALTSNPVLNQLSGKSQKDVHAIIQIATSGSREGISFEGNYSVEDINDMVSVMKKLVRIRDTILRVNQEYIRSAAQADAYRTEPPFRLQGSYRNMNRLAERVLPVMNDQEVNLLIADHYKNEAQNLTTGAEANLLKFRELEGILSEAETQRWDEIKRTFRRNLILQGADQTDPVGKVVAQMATFAQGLESIRSVLADAANRPPPAPAVPATPAATSDGGIAPVVEQFARFAGNLEALQGLLAETAKLAADRATFKLVDPSAPSDYQITSVSQETLQKIWELVAEDRKKRDQQAGTVGEPPAGT